MNSDDRQLQYFLPFGLDRINNFIEKAILDADEKGVKVLSLAALNKVFHFWLSYQPSSVHADQMSISRSH